MTSRPIIFSAPMVRAILDGTKTQTRRIMRPQPNAARITDIGKTCFTPSGMLSLRGTTAEPMANFGEWFYRPRYGFGGDRLWVRETWRTMERPEDCVDGVRFLADGSFVSIANTKKAADQWMAAHDNGKHGVSFRPSIYMPRWASRITLDVISVRVERVNSISRDDAIAEGAKRFDNIPTNCAYPDSTPRWSMESPDHTRQCLGSPQMAFANLWQKLNSKRAPWESNPFVWVIEFRRHVINLEVVAVEPRKKIA